MDFVVELKDCQDEETFSKITEHDEEDEGDDDLVCDIPDEDSILLVHFQGSTKSHKTKMVESFSIPKVIIHIRIALSTVCEH